MQPDEKQRRQLMEAGYLQVPGRRQRRARTSTGCTRRGGVPAGTIDNHTALLGVLLNDGAGPDGGNLTVWPGSHLVHAAYFAEHGPRSLLEGMPPVERNAPVQITGRAGDAVVCRYLLAHAVARNVGAHIRYAVYFRLRHRDHDALRWDSMTDPWLEWEGLRLARAG